MAGNVQGCTTATSTRKLISKAELNALPLGGYEGDIHLANTEAQLSDALRELEKASLWPAPIRFRKLRKIFAPGGAKPS